MKKIISCIVLCFSLTAVHNLTAAEDQDFVVKYKVGGEKRIEVDEKNLSILVHTHITDALIGVCKGTDPSGKQYYIAHLYQPK